MSTQKSNVIDYNDENANMYGCQPCPKCGSLYRVAWPTGEPTKEHPRGKDMSIECDDCGFKEIAEEQ